jgi:hypothetical protein
MRPLANPEGLPAHRDRPGILPVTMLDADNQYRMAYICRHTEIPGMPPVRIFDAGNEAWSHKESLRK